MAFHLVFYLWLGLWLGSLIVFRCHFWWVQCPPAPFLFDFWQPRGVQKACLEPPKVRFSSGSPSGSDFKVVFAVSFGRPTVIAYDVLYHST